MSIPIDQMIATVRGPKLCLGCRSMLPGAPDRCGDPRAAFINPVTGEREQYSCAGERFHGCGPDAMYWQPRTEQEAA